MLYPAPLNQSNFLSNEISNKFSFSNSTYNYQACLISNINNGYSSNANYNMQIQAPEHCSRMKSTKGDFYNRSRENNFNSMLKKKNKTRTATSQLLEEIDFHKFCPGCSRFWKKCKCSNIKNRPHPKPYSKFVPPRMQQNK